MKHPVIAFAICTFALCAQAAGLDTLENFLKTAKSGKAEFTQVVTGPAKNGQPPRTRTSSGTFEFVRPNRFRFDYRKPFEQTIVADGQTLWIHDVDLKQVTTRKQSQVLGSTPAALISAAPDLDALRKDFVLEPGGSKEGIEWVTAIPKFREGQLARVKIGFRGNDLAALEILDSFGQTSVLTFNHMEVNAALPASNFQFKPPQGVDVVKQ